MELDQRRGQIIFKHQRRSRTEAPGSCPHTAAPSGIELHVGRFTERSSKDAQSGTRRLGITYLDDLPDPLVSVPVGSEVTVVLPRLMTCYEEEPVFDLKDQPLVSLSSPGPVIDGAALSMGLTLNHVVTVPSSPRCSAVVPVLAIAPGVASFWQRAERRAD